MKKHLLPILAIIFFLCSGFAGFTLWSLYPHNDPQPLPEALIAFDSEAGIERLAGSEAMADYQPLIAHFEPQVTVSFCGVASSVAVLNALGQRTSQVRFFNDDTDKVRRDWQVLFGGMSLEELAGLLRAHGVQASAHHGDTFTLEAFRDTVQRNLSTPDDYLLVNYQREVLGQGKVGHISPLAAYDRGTDSVLVMDTSAHHYPLTWVPLPLLFEAMNTTDSSSGKMRGFVEVRQP